MSIEFQESPAGKSPIQFNDTPSAAPVAARPSYNRGAAETTWRDLTVIQEAARLRFKFITTEVLQNGDHVGKNVIRFLPPLVDGDKFIELINVVVAPKHFQAVSQPGDLFSKAQQWLWHNRKDLCERWEKDPNGKEKDKKVDGINLNPKVQGMAWVIRWDEEGKAHLGLLQKAYGNSAKPGLLGEISNAAFATERNPETGLDEPIYEHSIYHTNFGRLVTIEKLVEADVLSKKKQPQYGTHYKATISSKANSQIHPLIDLLPDEERAMVQRLSKIIRYTTADEQRALLAGYLGAQLVVEMGI